MICLLAFLVTAEPVLAQTDQKQQTQTVEAHEHNYVPLREVEMEIKDFSFPTLRGTPLRLSEAAKDKKLVLVHYFAAWCHNSNYDVKTMADLYTRYFDQGLLVIGVCEYSRNDELREFIQRNNPTYPICIEGEGKKKNRTGTTHYAYRKKVDDQRLWGTPLNILISAEDLLADGEIVAKRVRVAPGEVIKTELEELIQQKLLKK
ncbi:MAG: TlpA family protein disulfide reductase [Blastocatellia bacterium]